MQIKLTGIFCKLKLNAYFYDYTIAPPGGKIEPELPAEVVKQPESTVPPRDPQSMMYHLQELLKCPGTDAADIHIDTSDNTLLLLFRT